MAKRIITPAKIIYQVSELVEGVSVTRPVATLNEAKKVVKDTLNFAKNQNKTIEKMSVKQLTWSAWYDGEPSPEPGMKLIWEKP